MSNDETLQKFIESSNFSSSLLGDIFKDVITKYPNESKRKHAIRFAVELFKRKYKPEMKVTADAVKLAKESSSNEYSADKDTDTRLMLRIPETLVARIESIIDEPAFLSNEAQEQFNEMNWFMREYPEFTVPTKI